MPMYTFQCKQCGELQDFSLPLADYDNDLMFPACTVCQAPTERTLVGSSPGFVLKGKGFHRVDYGKDYGNK